MKSSGKLALGMTAAVALAACTAGQTPGPPINPVNVGDPNYSHLQFAVGTANIYGTVT
jgi:hypothetical protein